MRNKRGARWSAITAAVQVVISGDKKLRRARRHWQREALLTAAGGAVVQVGEDAAEIVRNHGEGPHNRTLAESAPGA